MTFQYAKNYARVLSKKQLKSVCTYQEVPTIEDVTGFDSQLAPEAQNPTVLDSSYIGLSPYFALNWQGATRLLDSGIDISQIKIPYSSKQIAASDTMPLLGLLPMGPIKITEANLPFINSWLQNGLLYFLGHNQAFVFCNFMNQVYSANTSFPYYFDITAPEAPSVTMGIFSNLFWQCQNNWSEFIERDVWNVRNLAFYSNVTGATQAVFTKCVQGNGFGLEVFSQDILNSVLWNGYCAKSLQDSGWESGDLVPVTFNFIGSGEGGGTSLLQPIPNLGITENDLNNPYQWAATVGVMNYGENSGGTYKWAANTSYQSIPKSYIPYDVWIQTGDINTMALSGMLLIWNKNITEPSIKISDLIPQATAWSSNGWEISLPNLPAASTASTATKSK